uniref:Uncharacterized protein n=1 Tax=Glossina palpalis gambiensis TaxID=67801 RepID=A0A1B0BR30_9MUSC
MNLLVNYIANFDSSMMKTALPTSGAKSVVLFLVIVCRAKLITKQVCDCVTVGSTIELNLPSQNMNIITA